MSTKKPAKKIIEGPMVLVVYDQIPEKSTLYVIPKDHPIIKSVILVLSNLYANGDELNKAQWKAFEAWYEWTNGNGKAFLREPPFKDNIVGVVRFGFLL